MSKTRSGILIAAALVAPTAHAQSLPEGPGKEAAATYCNSCHTLLSRVGSGYTQDGWQTVLRMMANHGVSAAVDREHPVTVMLTSELQQVEGT